MPSRSRVIQPGVIEEAHGVADLVRKSFYIHGDQARQIAEHIFETYLRTGHRLTESEIVRQALGPLFPDRSPRKRGRPGQLALSRTR